MRRSVFAMLSACVLVSLAILTSPAKAGDYYEDGYSRHRHSGNVWYSSDCCYKKVIRHERSVRYVPVDEERRYERHGYYDRPYRSSSYYDTPRRYVDDSYVPRRYDSYSSYSSGYSSYADSCYTRRAQVEDGRGGWVWGVRRVCE